MNVQEAWNRAKQTPTEQIDSFLSSTFTEDPKSWPVGVEKVAVATMISAFAVVATGGLGLALPGILQPLLMPLVAGLANVAVDTLNDFLTGLHLRADSFCEHPELQPKDDRDDTWIHYPGRHGYGFGSFSPGWGKLGLQAVTPALSDYEAKWSRKFRAGLGPDITFRVLRIPETESHEPFHEFCSFWYPIYARIKEANALQPCSRLSSEAADTQERAALLAFVAMWNRTHAASTSYVFAAANAGDDVTLVSHETLTIHTGPVARPHHVGPLHRLGLDPRTYMLAYRLKGHRWVDADARWHATLANALALLATFDPPVVAYLRGVYDEAWHAVER